MKWIGLFWCSGSKAADVCSAAMCRCPKSLSWFMCGECVMILTMTLFTLWFGFSSYVHREVDGALYWIVSTINSFVLLRFVILVGEIENRWHASCIFFAVLGVSLVISFVFKKLKICSRAEGG